MLIAPPSPVDKLLSAMREHKVTLGGGSTAVYQMLINAATAENPRHVPTLRSWSVVGHPAHRSFTAGLDGSLASLSFTHTA